MIHGADIDIAAVRTQAKNQVQERFVALGEADGTPATLRAMYVLKVSQAEEVLAGRESVNRSIEREAEVRGYTPYQMATVILWMAGESIELELRRIGINVEIDSATDEVAIAAIMERVGVPFHLEI